MPAAGNAMDNETRATVTALYKAYAEGNSEGVAALLHDDIDWIIHGPARIFPFEGPRRGKAAVLEALEKIAEQFELKSYVPELVIVEGDRAAVLSNTSFVQRATARTLSIRLVNFLRVANGQVIEFREFS